MTLSFDTEIIKHYMFDHFYLMTLLDSPLFPVSTALVLLIKSNSVHCLIFCSNFFCFHRPAEKVFYVGDVTKPPYEHPGSSFRQNTGIITKSCDHFTNSDINIFVSLA